MPAYPTSAAAAAANALPLWGTVGRRSLPKLTHLYSTANNFLFPFKTSDVVIRVAVGQDKVGLHLGFD